MTDRIIKPILGIDFDGVLHSYKSGWQGADNIPDLPVDGAIEWLRLLLEDGRFWVAIYSSRNSQMGGISAMKSWLTGNGLTLGELALISFPIEKPPVFVTLDDRAITFMGEFPSLEELSRFKPWYLQRKEK